LSALRVPFLFLTPKTEHGPLVRAVRLAEQWKGIERERGGERGLGGVAEGKVYLEIKIATGNVKCEI
jgi:hypothetical protein